MPSSNPVMPRFMSDGGVCGALARATDWSQTAVGPTERWSNSLRTTVGTLLHSRHPMFLFWGADLVQFYNDAYLPSFGRGKHPAAMGQRGRDCWQEIWPIIYPQIEDVMTRGLASWNEDQLVPIFRNGCLEEVYWTYSYSPVFDDDDTIGGTIVVVTETTSRVLAARRFQTSRACLEVLGPLDELAALDQSFVTTLSSSSLDYPWSLVCRFDRGSSAPPTVVSSGLDSSQQTSILGLLTSRLTALPVGPESSVLMDTPAIPTLPGVDGQVPSVRAVLLPLASQDEIRTSYLLVGVSPRLPFDHEYESHIRALARQLDGALARSSARRGRDEADRGRNNLLLQAPVAAALLVGPRWQYQVSNSLYEQMVGRKVVGRFWHDVFPELRDGPVEAILRGVYERGEPFFASEQLVPLARESDGVVEERFVDFNMIPIRDDTGAVGAMMVVAVEMTAQVLARRELERTAKERENLLTELESANRAKDEFLAMLGHELRNPLSPIVTALALMRLRSTPPGREEQIIERQVTHLVRLVDDLLDISKITRGKIELRKEEVAVADVLAKAVDIASHLLERRHHELVVEVSPGTRWYGDPIRLAQVVSNLLTNAGRYTPTGGKIRLAATVEGAELVIGVEDNGVGLAADMLPRVFELFYQGNRNPDRSEGGLGLGLALVKNLVAMHGGTVLASSEGIGRGSTFVIRLPVVASSETTAAVTARANSSRNTPKKVLIVDDNADAAELLSEILRSLGHEVTVATDPVTALAVAPRFGPQIALLDIGLPVMDGYELAAKLREVLAVDCRMIALTGYGQSHDREKSLSAGFSEHLVKPVDLPKLVALVGLPS